MAEQNIQAISDMGQNAQKRIVCLYRVSTIGQVDKDDIPMQKQSCRGFCRQHPGWEIVKEFSEKGVSGFKVSARDRDAIQEIQKMALQGEFDILLVFMFDRLGRKDDETPFVVEWFVKQNIEVWSAMEGQQRFDNHVDKLLNYIRYWQASGESIKTSSCLSLEYQAYMTAVSPQRRAAPCPLIFGKGGRLMSTSEMLQLCLVIIGICGLFIQGKKK